MERLAVARIDPAAANAVGDQRDFHTFGQQGAGRSIDLDVAGVLAGKVERHDADVGQGDERSDFRAVALCAAVEGDLMRPLAGRSGRLAGRRPGSVR